MPNYITNAGTMFPTTLVREMFNSVQAHSSLAKLSPERPIPFNGATQFVFSAAGKAQLVGEGEQKKQGDATVNAVVIRPVKLVYQHRVSDEFLRASDETALEYLRDFSDGFAKKIAEGLDIAAMHGLDPYTMTAASSLADKNFDAIVTGNVVPTADDKEADELLDAAVQMVIADGRKVTGIAMAPQFASGLAAIKVNGVPQYPEYRFGQNPDAFYGMGSDVNSTVSAAATGAATADGAIVGDFRDAFRWGYAAQVPLEVIQFGDPDGAGRDLKQYNEVCLRAEAYIGWGILDADSFARVVLD